MALQAKQLNPDAATLVRIVRGGQITLPADFRKALKVEEGTYLEAEVVDGALNLRPVTLVNPAEAERRLEEILSRVKPQEREPQRSEDELLSEVADIIRQSRRTNAEGGAR